MYRYRTNRRGFWEFEDSQCHRGFFLLVSLIRWAKSVEPGLVLIGMRGGSIGSLWRVDRSLSAVEIAIWWGFWGFEDSNSVTEDLFCSYFLIYWVKSGKRGLILKGIAGWSSLLHLFTLVGIFFMSGIDDNRLGGDIRRFSKLFSTFWHFESHENDVCWERSLVSRSRVPLIGTDLILCSIELGR